MKNIRNKTQANEAPHRAKVVVAVTSRALFDLQKENEIFEKEGGKSYYRYQLRHEEKPLSPGPGFQLVKQLLAINKKYYAVHPKALNKLVEVVIISKNSPEAGIRIFNSIQTHGLDISRGVFLGGDSAVHYLQSFYTDLFLSMEEQDVKEALKAGFAAGKLYHLDKPSDTTQEEKEVRIALDADRVVFSGESEAVFDAKGMEAFHQSEISQAKISLPDGPFGQFIRTMGTLKNEFPIGDCPISLAIVTARNSSTHERVLRTFREWKVKIDKIFFLGGLPKSRVLEKLKPHIFFDDKKGNIELSRQKTPSAEVLDMT